ncbi:hypothetical protein E4U53_001358, partial [Claviceps sorghi]
MSPGPRLFGAYSPHRCLVPQGCGAERAKEVAVSFRADADTINGARTSNGILGDWSPDLWG